MAGAGGSGEEELEMAEEETKERDCDRFDEEVILIIPIICIYYCTIYGRRAFLKPILVLFYT